MNSKKNLKRNLLICLLAGSAVMYTLPLHAATSVIGNNTLPTGGSFVHGNGSITSAGLEMNVIQNGQNAVIKWGSFDVGGSATVNFSSKGAYANNFNTLNYVNSASASQIYGTINAQGGNIFIVNPAGVQIGNSAQINVGSLYVSSNTLNDSALKNFYNNAGKENFVLGGTRNADIELMSLGNINANKVTFEGNGRIVIDSERIKNAAGSAVNNDFEVHTNDAGNVLIGYDAYNEIVSEDSGTVHGKGTYEGKQKTFSNNVYVNGKLDTTVKGYMWVEDVKQLQAIDTNLGGNYALRNSIDGTQANNFKSIGSNTAFSGKFDGIDYNIFNLNISGTDNVGLFGKTNGATINNVTLVGGSITGTGSNVGAIVGNANNTTLTNVVNSAAVSGKSNVGGIVGTADGTTVENAINTGTIEGNSTSETNVGGLIGEMKDSNTADNYKSQIIGNSYNLGDVSGNGHNVGGLVGYAVNSVIGNEGENAQLVYNRMDVTGAYNVGGIVGNMVGSTVQNAENSGTVLASRHYDGKYIFHTNNAAFDGNGDKLGEKDVYIANAGGIAGTSSDDSTITDVLNTGNVSSSKQDGKDFYDAGNVGGIVGSAVDTDITNATNRENEVRGAHNVGGVAGYFGNSSDDDSSSDYIVTNGINDGGDIMATGARNASGFVTEKVRSTDTGAEETIIGNMGGVVGYLDGNNVYVTGSANRGTVHSLDITGDTVSQASQASNTGGVVGKIDRSGTKTLSEIKNNIKNAAVSNSYNTGDVRGYMGVGGVVGMMYNGEVAGSYNLGSINTTRRAADAASNAYPSVNMGGVVGDTTEQTTAKALIYDVYNKGQIGDETYNYYARHVGGVVGRLSGDVEKAYNTGAIYNGYNVVGGIVGYMSVGKINNVFNTGNITVVHNDGTDVGVQLGGLVGAANIGRGNTTISNAYNLGVIRAFKGKADKKTNGVGGVVGTVVSYKGISGESEGELDIKNVYTTGDLYSENGKVGAVYGSAIENAQDNEIDIHNVVYIKPSNTTDYGEASTQGADTINYSDMNKGESWRTFIDNANGQEFGNVDLDSTSGLWRVYDGTTPILNEFTPNSKEYFYNHNDIEGITNIQYGTAYNPLLTIIEASKDLSFDWQQLGINNDAGLAVYGAGVTLDNFKATGGTGYYGGTIYADGNLKLDGNRNDISLGSASQIYGSSVTIKTDGKVTIYGDVTATGNAAGGESAGDITVTGGDVDVYGQLTSATKGEATNIAGIGKEYGTINNVGDIKNKYDDIANIGDHYAHTTGASAVDGNITINAGTNADGENIGNGNVNLYFGNKEQGLITTGGSLTVTGTGDVYVDSDLDIAGNVTLTSTGKDGEVLLTLTNIGKVQADRFMDVVESAINGVNLNNVSEDELRDTIFNAVNASGVDNSFTEKDAEIVAKYLIGKDTDKVQVLEQLNNDVAVEYMHDFMHSFDKTTDNYIALNAASGNAKLTVDMWVENSDGSGKFDFAKYDSNFTGTGDGHTFIKELEALEFYINEEDVGNNDKIADASKHVYVEVHNGEQLKGIQDYVDSNVENASDALKFNYALMGDINASDVENYVAIGTKSANGFTGTFDGRGNRIIGLNVDKVKGQNTANAGIFDTIGTNGVVKDVNIYSGTFTGTTTAGAVAGVNNGRIEGIVTFGNTVTVTGDNSNVSNAGGIVGVNNSGTFENNANDGELTGGIYDVESTGSVIAGSSDAVAGGLVGTNNGGLANSFSDSAVTVKVDNQNPVTTTGGLGGVVGVNTEKGNVQYVDSLGVTNGGATGSSNIGGIIGTNNGNMYSGYNESIVSGANNVGGIIGTNAEGKKVENVVNATGVEGDDNVGGLVGVNSGSVTNGRNNGTITGNEYVGGLVGNNASKNSVLTNLVNDSSASITGVKYVGGIAGSNAGTITTGNKETDETVNLINRGTITGQQYVGGVAGRNSGTIINANNDVELNVKDSTADAEFFGGIAGENTKGGIIKNATNTADVNADGATYVGGIVGKNDGTLENMAGNSGNVTGENYVGGVAGQNTNNKPLNGVEASNTGTVFATAGGAGGIFAVNNANITNSKLTNNGTVIGNSGNGTGGIFGVNSGDISESSLINEVDGQVIGTNNVGGLIGVNTGNIEGGRYTVAGEDAGMYINKIYNNGVINVGTYIYNNQNGEYEFKVDTGSNIGGLIGDNQKGSLTAGYNTGAINASGSTNVGGIAGSNSGTIDQVFNTVMTPDNAVKPDGSKQEASITGGTNVGGLVGNNQANGEITNAYNTSNVVATNQYGIVGGLVGNNQANGEITNAYNTSNVVTTNQDGIVGNLVGKNSGTVQYVYGVASNLIGNGNAAEYGYVIDGSDTWLQEGTYAGFKFGANGWKIYDGSTLPMLSVFLTKVTVVDQHLVDQYFSAKHYGEFHQITADDIKALIAIGAISAPDGFGAFNKNNGLIQGVADDAMANSGNWLYSGQIADSFVNGIFNPNNLGYDISLVYSPFELDNDPSSHWNYLFNDAPFDRNKDFRERKAEVNFVDGGMEI